ncbi:TfoX/Sxy family DNA transformation protein [Kaistia nematophila]|uniref:TfoX/Sxy family DNA transformation protein n=1 Tax=Kaistia nematophila TaxID=2994654 RepID=A0A9X3E8Q9_9HYPH|nr:TfoX/Sxy family DNA transformation protein [Kaistia nematophila]MBN9024914.1 TfoX/Sxy family DNA transformation protein [Hyphomicrobiales bacterium]MCX5568855.1 TfoX/Sxy family DNA transformation protein [Kaistia nematophila]
MSDRPIRLVPGIGPTTAGWLEAVDIRFESDLRRIGAVEAYWRLKHRDPDRVSLNALWCLYAVIEDIPMRAVDAESKSRLRAQLDSGNP